MLTLARNNIPKIMFAIQSEWEVVGKDKNESILPHWTEHSINVHVCHWVYFMFWFVSHRLLFIESRLILHLSSLLSLFYSFSIGCLLFFFFSETALFTSKCIRETRIKSEKRLRFFSSSNIDG